uniref:Uncharacterized protein n=1 Tax=Knipowitschia caucasica TaxID=637954 RepID=A0AAV2J517_KNICA
MGGQWELGPEDDKGKEPSRERGENWTDAEAMQMPGGEGRKEIHTQDGRQETEMKKPTQNGSDETEMGNQHKMADKRQRWGTNKSAKALVHWDLGPVRRELCVGEVCPGP